MKRYAFNIYVIIIIAIVPLIITPYGKDVFNNMKLAIVISSTILFILIDVIISKSSYKFSKLDSWITSYAVVLLLSTLLSINLKFSVFGIPRSSEGFISLLSYVFIFLIFYKNYKLISFKTIELVFIASAIISFIGILQIYHINPLLNTPNNEFLNNITSTIGQRNFVGTYCTLLLSISIGIFIMKGFKRYAVYSIMLFALMLGSVTRSSWIAFAFYSIVLLYFALKNKKVNVKKLIAVFIICIAAFAVINQTNHGLFSVRAKEIVHDAKNIDEDTSGSTRIYIWKKTVPMLFDRPLLGSGPDTFGILYNSGEKPKYKILFDKAHNEYLQIALTEGIPTLLLYLAIVLYILRSLYRGRNKSFINVILLCSITGYLIQAFFNISFISVAPIYWAILGISAGLGSET